MRYPRINILSIRPGMLFAMHQHAPIYRLRRIEQDGAACRIHATDAVSGNPFTFLCHEELEVSVAQ